MPAHKLQGRTDFQGLPISIENRKGSVRHWYDVEAQKAGTTKMKFPYGYVRGTLGLDGDEVDVYIGNNKESDKVFLITQNKAPEFTEIDEQKVMLGFNSPAEAKMAYFAHMDKRKAFRAMKEMSVEQFKAKLASHKGKLIKGALITDKYSGKMGDTASLPERVKKDKKSMTTAAEDLEDVTKALTAAIAGGFAQRARMEARVAEYNTAQRAFNATPVAEVPTNVGIAEAQPQLGTSRVRPAAEPPVVPVRAIHNEVPQASSEAEVYKSCVSCGRLSKSLACLTCDNTTDSSATPVWRR